MDASYTVNNDMKSHTGVSLTLGRGTLLSISCKKKLVRKSSDEAKFVCVNDAMTLMMWGKYFVQEQNKDVPDA